MILYVNGDSNCAAAEAVNDFAFAMDDPRFHYLGRKPHPDNLEVSFAKKLADKLTAKLDMDAESASSNDRIIRTTLEYLKTNRPDLILIGWSTWERQEHFKNGVYYQFCAGWDGFDWPQDVVSDYKTWVLNVPQDPKQHVNTWHEKIYDFHKLLKEKQIRHLFFNIYDNFKDAGSRYNWEDCYLGDPYEDNYFGHLVDHGFIPTKLGYHFKEDAHEYWANYLFSYLTSDLISIKITK
jgi:hypothetical protein